MECRKLICKNDLMQMNKKYKPLELKAFYNMLYCYKEQKAFNKDLIEEEETYLELSHIKKYLNCGNYSNDEILNIIYNMPKGIYSRDRKHYVSVFDSIDIEEDDTICYKISDTFKHMLDDIIKDFTVFNLGELSQLKSNYSQKIYEIASRYKNQKDYRMTIEDFRRDLNIPDSYIMCNIDQRVIRPSEKEINDNTGLNISIGKLKKGRKVTHIVIKFR